MEKYGFDKFNNQGDNSYDKRGGIYTDSECNNVYLPTGFNNPDNENTEEPSDGAISFLKYLHPIYTDDIIQYQIV